MLIIFNAPSVIFLNKNTALYVRNANCVLCNWLGFFAWIVYMSTYMHSVYPHKF